MRFHPADWSRFRAIEARADAIGNDLFRELDGESDTPVGAEVTVGRAATHEYIRAGMADLVRCYCELSRVTVDDLGPSTFRWRVWELVGENPPDWCLVAEGSNPDTALREFAHSHDRRQGND